MSSHTNLRDAALKIQSAGSPQENLSILTNRNGYILGAEVTSGPDQEDEHPAIPGIKREPIWESLFLWASQNPLPLLTGLGLVLFAVQRTAFQTFYQKYGVTPEDVGLDYTGVLLAQASSVLGLVVLSGMVWLFGWTLSRRHNTGSRTIASYARMSQREAAELRDEARKWADKASQFGSAGSGYAAHELSNLTQRIDELEKMAEKQAKLADFVRSPKKTRLQRTTFFLLVTIVGLWCLLLLLSASLTAVGPRRPWSVIDPLQIHVDRVDVYWLASPGSLNRTRRLLPQDVGLSQTSALDLLSLGRTSTTAIFFDIPRKHVIRIPEQSISVIER